MSLRKCLLLFVTLLSENKKYLQELSLLYLNSFKAVQLHFICFGALSIVLNWSDAGHSCSWNTASVPRIARVFYFGCKGRFSFLYSEFSILISDGSSQSRTSEITGSNR